MIFQLLMIVWLSTGPEFVSSGMLPDQAACQQYARDVTRMYPRGTTFDAKCIQGQSI